MKKLTLTIAMTLIVCAAASIALAQNFTTVNGKQYKNATVSRVEPDGIVLKTKSGISKVYFVELPKEDQERFRYDPQKAAAAHAADTAAMAAIQHTNQEVEESNKQRREVAQQKGLENRLSQLQQQDERLVEQIRQAEIGAAGQEAASRANIQRFEDEAREEMLGQPRVRDEIWLQGGKWLQYAQRQRQYEGAKIAAARRRLNSNMVVPPRYGDVYYDPLSRLKEAMSQSGEQAAASGSVENLLGQLDSVRKEKEQVRQKLAAMEPVAPPSPQVTPPSEPDCLIVATKKYWELPANSWKAIGRYNEKTLAPSGHAALFFQPTPGSNVAMYDKTLGSLELPTQSHELREILAALSRVLGGVYNFEDIRWVAL